MQYEQRDPSKVKLVEKGAVGPWYYYRGGVSSNDNNNNNLGSALHLMVWRCETLRTVAAGMICFKPRR